MQRVTAGLTGDNETSDDWKSPVLGGMVSGALKSGAGLLGNVLDMVSKPKMPPWFEAQYRQQNPNATPQEAEQAYEANYKQTMGGRNAGHIQDAADWLRSGGQAEGFWQNVGAIGEQALEYIGTDGLLKLVGPAAGAVDATEHLKQAQQTAQVLKNNPKLAGLVATGLKASKDALMMGAQTYGHTEDPTQAAAAAATGGVVRGAAEGLGAAGRYLQKISPKTVNIAGHDVTALASQVNPRGFIQEGGAEAAPAIAEGQQQVAPKVIQTTAQGAAQKVLDHINSTRPFFASTGEASRLLPAPEGATPFTFTLEGPGAGEEQAGQIAHDAAKFDPTGARVPAGATPGAKNVQELGSTASTVPARMQSRTQAYTKEIASVGPGPAPGAEGPVNIGPTQTQPKGRIVGGGIIQSTDPAEAQQWLRQIEDIQSSPLHDSMSDAQQAQLEKQRQALSEQLGIYHSSPYAQRFEAVDPQAATAQVRNFGDAADAIQTTAKPVYATLDEASGGDFNKQNNAAKQALKIMRSATSVDAFEAAQSRYEDATKAIDDLITRHSDKISRADYTAAKTAWRASSRLDELHTLMQRMGNGITADETEAGLQAAIRKPNVQSIQNYLEKGTNQAQVEELIGKEGIRNLKQVVSLFTTVKGSRAGSEVSKNVAAELMRQMGGGAGIGGFIGGMSAKERGKSWYAGMGEGMAYGALAGAGMRTVIYDAMMNPRIGNAISYAARNGLSPQHYAPLIARMLAVPMQEQQPEEQPPAEDH
jgi:hypothetical protein